MEAIDFSEYRSKDQDQPVSSYEEEVPVNSTNESPQEAPQEAPQEDLQQTNDKVLGPSNLFEFAEQSQLNQPPEQIFDPSQYKTEDEKGWIREGLETAGQSALGITSGIFGAPGDLHEAVLRLIKYTAERASDTYLEYMGEEKFSDKEKEDIYKIATSGPIQQFATMILPTSDKVEVALRNVLGDKIMPTSETQKKAKEIGNDVGSLFSPITGPISFMRSVGATLFGEGAQQLAKEFGATESQQNKIKAASTFIATIFNPGQARRYANNLLEQSYRHINPGDVVPTRKLLGEVSAFNRNLIEGGMTPNKRVVYNLSRQLEHDLTSNASGFSPRILAKYRNSINELRFSRGLGSQQGGLFPRGLPAPTQHHLNHLDEFLNTGLNNYGRQNPTFLSFYRDGNLALSGLHRANTLQNTISKNIDLNLLNPETMAILGLHGGPQAVSKAVTLASLGKATSILRRVATNKPLRRHYMDVLRYGTEKNIPMLRRSLGFLDKQIEKEK